MIPRPEQHQPLRGKRIVVTRPAHQADDLCRRLERLGAEAPAFPTLTIEPIDDPAARDRLAANHWHWLVFVSANAVDGACTLTDPGHLRRLPSRLAAVGRATADRLRQRIRAPELVPAWQQGAAGLLQTPELTAVEGQRILIVRGRGGSEALARGLRARGAEVDYAEVYRRRRPEPEPAQVRRIWLQRTPDLVICTSLHGLRNLEQMLRSQPAASTLRQCQLVVVSQAMVKEARHLGFAQRAILSAPGDPSLVETAVSCFRGESP